VSEIIIQGMKQTSVMHSALYYVLPQIPYSSSSSKFSASPSMTVDGLDTEPLDPESTLPLKLLARLRATSMREPLSATRPPIGRTGESPAFALKLARRKLPVSATRRSPAWPTLPRRLRGSTGLMDGSRESRGRVEVWEARCVWIW
jgi:hypothetical protein